jgi:phosphoenolpyruvate-protein phosphotransferase
MKQFKGIPASPGIAVAPAFIYRPVELLIPSSPGVDPAVEWQRCQSAMIASQGELAELHQKAASEFGEEEAAIFEAHQMILSDPEMEAELRAELEAGACAEAAIEIVYARAIKTFQDMDDPFFRARGMDFVDVRRRLLCLLMGIQDRSLAELDFPAIILAQDLMPSDTAQMNKAMVKGFCTAGGGPLSHTAILARNLGLPAIVGAGEAILGLSNGAPLIVDGDEGLLIAEAGEHEQAAYLERATASAGSLAAAQAQARAPAITRDGRRVEIVANVGLPGEEADALLAGAEGIGLLRTEFLFVGRGSAPSEEEQFRAYRSIFEAMGDRPVIARTLDIGGDKPAPFLSVPPEDNPYLGWRAIRIGLSQPELLKTQLRALLRAGYERNLKIMFPMIATIGEIEAARQLLDEARGELAARGEAFAASVEVGTMVEVPSAAIMADLLAKKVDFFSIGSNDLTQYTLAADRGNPAVAALTDSLHPAVLRLIDQVIHVAHATGIWVGLCGELAGDLAAIPVLLGLGLDEFSMGPAAIPGAKALIRRLSLAETQKLAGEALDQPDAKAVRKLVRNWMRQLS